MKNSKLRRMAASVLIAALLLPQAAVAAAPTVETDEAVYINLDYYGVPSETRIVKGVSLNGHTEFTDYGAYDGVYNMSTYDEPDLSTDGAVTWTLEEERQRFYYECVPQADTVLEMPWDFDISYKLNGVPVEAEKCAGASGMVEMTIHAMPNDKAGDYYKNNMMLVCATGIDMSKMLSIEAPGAQIQSMGTYKIVMFMGLPGEEQTFTVRIGSNSFESMGLILFMAPATLSSLDILADMRDIKDRLSDSGDNLYEGLSSMLDTLQSMKSGMDTLSNGVRDIDEVRRQLTASRGTLDPKTDAALAALEELAGKSDSLIPELNSMKTTLVTLNATVNSMLGTLHDSTEELGSYQTLLRQLRGTLGDLEDFADDLDDATDSNWLYIDEMQDAISDLRKHGTTLKSDLSSMDSRLGELNSELSTMKTLLVTISGALGASEDPSDHATAMLLSELGNLISEAQSSISALRDMLDTLRGVTGDMDELLSTADAVLDGLDDINDVIDDYDGLAQDLIGEGKRLTVLAEQTLERVDKLLADIPALSTSLNQMTTDAVSAADKGSELMVSLTKTLDASADLLNEANETLRAVRADSDAGMQSTIDGLLDVLDKATRSNSSSTLQKANDSIHSAMDDAEKDLEEDTNMLNLDASAELQSVTSDQNPSPASLQFILRTDEITIDDEEEDAAALDEEADEGALRRIFNIFKKLVTAIAGVFASEE